MRDLTLVEEFILPDTCQATSKQSGKPCGRHPIPGGTVCHVHGGAAPQTRAKALGRIVQARDLALDRLMERLAPPNDDDEYKIDAKVLLDIVDKLTAKVQLLSGEATSRDESRKVEAVRHQLELKLDQISPRVEELLRAAGSPGEIVDVEAIEEIEEVADGQVDKGGGGETPELDEG